MPPTTLPEGPAPTPLAADENQTFLVDVEPLSLVVDTLTDEQDGSIDDGDISLRDALGAIALFADGGMITFDPGLVGGSEAGVDDGVLTLSQALGELAVSSDVTIDGDVIGGDDVADITISGDSDGSGSHSPGDTRIFDVSGGTVTIKSLDIADGYTSANGGAILLRDGAALNLINSTVRDSYSQVFGGGIANDKGTLNITASTISGNTAAFGGGVSNYEGSLTVIDSTVNGNESVFDGGGIWSDTDLATTRAIVSNSTIANNAAGGPGGGIRNFDGRLDIQNSTIAGNSSDAAGGSGVSSFGDEATRTYVASSLIAGNADNANVDFGPIADAVSFISQGANLIGGGDPLALAAFDQPGDQTGIANALLGALQDNGGPTQTIALLPGSLAIDAGSNPNGLTNDQRGDGFARSSGNGVDVGAFETKTAEARQFVNVDFNGGFDGFGYRDDIFRNTDQPDFADGGRVTTGGAGNTPALRVDLGGINGDDIGDPGMSGGFEASFTLAEATELTLSFFYRLDVSGGYEDDEFSEVLVSLTNGGTTLFGLGDNDFVERVFGDGGAATPREVSESRVTLDLGAQPPGDYTLALGGRNNKKTTPTENTILVFDDVRLAETDAVPSPAIVDADFTTGSDDFVYVDDAFRNTNEPDFADGGRVTSGGDGDTPALQMALGGINGDDIGDPGMSGGFETTFTLSEATQLDLSFFFRLDMSGGYEDDEFSEVLVSLTNGTTELFGRDDNDFVERLTGDAGMATPRVVSQDTVSLDLGVQDAGTYTLTLGGRNNKKTTANEDTLITFDNVLLEAGEVPAPPVVDASFESGAEGFAYRDDAFGDTNEPGFADGGRETTGGTDNSPALQMELGGINGDDVGEPGMSGGFDTSFTLDQATNLTLSFFYRLDMSGAYEDDEFSEVLVSLTNGGSTLFGQNDEDFVDRMFGDAGPAMPRVVSEDRVTLDLGLQEAGDYTLTLGGRNNKKTTASENTIITFDDVLLEAGSPSNSLTSFSSALGPFEALEQETESFGTGSEIFIA